MLSNESVVGEAVSHERLTCGKGRLWSWTDNRRTPTNAGGTRSSSKNTLFFSSSDRSNTDFVWGFVDLPNGAAEKRRCLSLCRFSFQNSHAPWSVTKYTKYTDHAFYSTKHGAIWQTPITSSPLARKHLQSLTVVTGWRLACALAV